jgi:hypothetical protein
MLTFLSEVSALDKKIDRHTEREREIHGIHSISKFNYSHPSWYGPDAGDKNKPHELYPTKFAS